MKKIGLMILNAAAVTLFIDSVNAMCQNNTLEEQKEDFNSAEQTLKTESMPAKEKKEKENNTSPSVTNRSNEKKEKSFVCSNSSPTLKSPISSPTNLEQNEENEENKENDQQISMMYQLQLLSSCFSGSNNSALQPASTPSLSSLPIPSTPNVHNQVIQLVSEMYGSREEGRERQKGRGETQEKEEEKKDDAEKGKEEASNDRGSIKTADFLQIQELIQIVCEQQRIMNLIGQNQHKSELIAENYQLKETFRGMSERIQSLQAEKNRLLEEQQRPKENGDELERTKKELERIKKELEDLRRMHASELRQRDENLHKQRAENIRLDARLKRIEEKEWLAQKALDDGKQYLQKIENQYQEKLKKRDKQLDCLQKDVTKLQQSLQESTTQLEDARLQFREKENMMLCQLQRMQQINKEYFEQIQLLQRATQQAAHKHRSPLLSQPSYSSSPSNICSNIIPQQNIVPVFPSPRSDLHGVASCMQHSSSHSGFSYCAISNSTLLLPPPPPPFPSVNMDSFSSLPPPPPIKILSTNSSALSSVIESPSSSSSFSAGMNMCKKDVEKQANELWDNYDLESVVNLLASLQQSSENNSCIYEKPGDLLRALLVREFSQVSDCDSDELFAVSESLSSSQNFSVNMDASQEEIRNHACDLWDAGDLDEVANLLILIRQSSDNSSIYGKAGDLLRTLLARQFMKVRCYDSIIEWLTCKDSCLENGQIRENFQNLDSNWQIYLLKILTMAYGLNRCYDEILQLLTGTSETEAEGAEEDDEQFKKILQPFTPDGTVTQNFLNMQSSDEDKIELCGMLAEAFFLTENYMQIINLITSAKYFKRDGSNGEKFTELLQDSAFNYDYVEIFEMLRFKLMTAFLETTQYKSLIRLLTGKEAPLFNNKISAKFEKNELSEQIQSILALLTAYDQEKMYGKAIQLLINTGYVEQTKENIAFTMQIKKITKCDQCQLAEIFLEVLKKTNTLKIFVEFLRNATKFIVPVIVPAHNNNRRPLNLSFNNNSSNGCLFHKAVSSDFAFCSSFSSKIVSDGAISMAIVPVYSYNDKLFGFSFKSE